MSRRALTQALGIGLALLLAFGGASRPVPYVVLSPGPAFNTLGDTQGAPVLKISGGKTYPTDGALDLTTVSVTDRITLFEALVGWFSRSDAVVPRELVIPPDQTQEQTDRQNAQQMRVSQDAATTAALRHIGLPERLEITVSEVAKDGPSAGRLEVGDVLTHVDGKRFSSATGLRALIGTRKPGASVRIGYLRKSAAGTTTIRTVPSTESPVRPIIGISLEEMHRFPVSVEIRLKDVGGPSAGLMFALGIIDKLGPDSLTGGRVIAGTGEIDENGKVGPIGGIPQKMLGARQRGATVFLVPSDNCNEAKHAEHDGLELVRVATLKSALAALKTLREGGSPPSC